MRYIDLFANANCIVCSRLHFQQHKTTIDRRNEAIILQNERIVAAFFWLLCSLRFVDILCLAKKSFVCCYLFVFNKKCYSTKVWNTRMSQKAAISWVFVFLCDGCNNGSMRWKVMPFTTFFSSNLPHIHQSRDGCVIISPFDSLHSMMIW